VWYAQDNHVSPLLVFITEPHRNKQKDFEKETEGRERNIVERSVATAAPSGRLAG